MEPRLFETASELRAWLEEHHEHAAELWVGFHKKGSGRPSITWPESVDEALCFGWIDGLLPQHRRRELQDPVKRRDWAPRAMAVPATARCQTRVREVERV